MAETYRSRTYLRPLSLTLVLKTRRNTGYETPPPANIKKTTPCVKLGNFLFPQRLALRGKKPYCYPESAELLRQTSPFTPSGGNIHE